MVCLVKSSRGRRKYSKNVHPWFYEGEFSKRAFNNYLILKQKVRTVVRVCMLLEQVLTFISGT